MRVLPVVALLIVTGCAVRQASPVRISQPGDADLTCSAIDAERVSNQDRALGLASQDKRIESGNTVAAVVASTVFPPAWGAVDLSNAERIEVEALIDRNRHLEELSRARGCTNTRLGASAARD